MKKQRFILVSLLFVLFAHALSAQNNANELINNAVKKIRDPKNIEISFNYFYHWDAKSSVIEVKEGKAYLQGEAYKVIMDEQQVISDGETIWTYLVDDEEVMVSNATEGSDNTPIKILTTLDKDFTAKLAGKDQEGMTNVELTNPKGPYKQITARIDGKTGTLKGVRLYAEDGSSVDLDIKETKTNQNLGDNFFTFDEKAYPDVEIIDMR